MENVNVSWNCGNFTVALATSVSADQFKILATRGLLHSGQRVSEIDKVLGGFEKGADGKSKRKAGWKRTDADYSDALRERLAECFATLEIAEDVKIPCTVSVVKYEGSGTEVKSAREKKKFAQWESEPMGLEAKLKAFAGYTGDTHGADGEYEPAALAAAKVAIDKAMAAF